MTEMQPGRTGEDFDQQVAQLIRALDKLPPRRGVSYRGRTSGSAFGREGQVLVTRLLTPTSRDIRVATENFTSAGLYVVIGRTGRDIETLSQRPQDQEVVFLPASMFLVVQSARVDDLPITIVEQLNPEQEGVDDPVGTLEAIGQLTARRVAEGRSAAPVEVHASGKFCGDIE